MTLVPIPNAAQAKLLLDPSGGYWSDIDKCRLRSEIAYFEIMATSPEILEDGWVVIGVLT